MVRLYRRPKRPIVYAVTVALTAAVLVACVGAVLSLA